MIDKTSAKVNWYPGTTKAATENGYEVVDLSGDGFFAKNSQSPENRGFRGRPQPMVCAWDGDFCAPMMMDETDD